MSAGGRPAPLPVGVGGAPAAAADAAGGARGARGRARRRARGALRRALPRGAPRRGTWCVRVAGIDTIRESIRLGKKNIIIISLLFFYNVIVIC